MWSEVVYFLKRPYHFLKTGIGQGLRAQLQYTFPEKKLKILTITGTDGKTTSSTLLYETLKAAGKKVGLVSTVAAYAGDEIVDTGFHVTSPDPLPLYAFMRQLVDQDYEYLVLEATSHGIYQYRTWGIRPLIAGVTNIDREHLDYHLDYDRYVTAKTMLLNQAHQVVLNAEDESFNRIKKHLNSGKKITTYGELKELPRSIKQAVVARFPQDYNQRNAALVATMAQLLGIPSTAVVKGIQNFKGVPGRWQEVANKRGLRIVVDFAHTPQAVEAVLHALRAQTPRSKQLIVVMGCAGLRDRGKRPVMGRLGAEIADVAIFTAEDPRTENVWAIIRQMKSELGKNHRKVVSMADRQAAIEFALNTTAQKGDTIAILGKGHEQSMNFDGQEYPWSDLTAVETALQQSRSKK